jgi:hypothetical protein
MFVPNHKKTLKMNNNGLLDIKISTIFSQFDFLKKFDHVSIVRDISK